MIRNQWLKRKRQYACIQCIGTPDNVISISKLANSLHVHVCHGNFSEDRYFAFWATCLQVFIFHINNEAHMQYDVQWRIQGGIRPWPPIEVGNGVCTHPLWGRKSRPNDRIVNCNDSIVNLSKFQDVGPPVSMSATDLAPNGKIAH